MVLIPFEKLLERLQYSAEIPNGILTGQEGLHYGDVRFMPQHHTLKMQHVPFPYFCHMVDDNTFAPLKCKLKDASSATAILLVYTTSTDLTFIEYVHIELVVHHAGSQVYEPKSIPAYITYFEEDARHIWQKLVAEGSVLKVHSYCMFICNFEGTMAAETDPPYCLVYPNIYKPRIPENKQIHFNVQGRPPGPLIHECMCCTLLHHVDPTIKNWQRHCDGCLVIPWGAQYDRLHLEVFRSRNHRAPLMDLKVGEVFPMVSVGDFALEDNIFPGTPGDSLLYTCKELDKLHRKGYQVAKHWLLALPAETSQPPRHSGEGNNSACKGRELAKVAGSPDKMFSHTQCSPPTKVCQESHDKERSTSKHQEKSRKDKEDSKSPHKCTGSLAQGSSTT